MDVEFRIEVEFSASVEFRVKAEVCVKVEFCSDSDNCDQGAGVGVEDGFCLKGEVFFLGGGGGKLCFVQW